MYRKHKLPQQQLWFIKMLQQRRSQEFLEGWGFIKFLYEKNLEGGIFVFFSQKH